MCAAAAVEDVVNARDQLLLQALLISDLYQCASTSFLHQLEVFKLQVYN